jgi:hypothetical protein
MGKRSTPLEIFEVEAVEETHPSPLDMTPQGMDIVASGKRHRRGEEPAEFIVAMPIEAPPPTLMDSSEATRAEVEQTRAEMIETIDAIKEKLEPQRIMEQAKETLIESARVKMEQALDKAIETIQTTSQIVSENARHIGEVTATKSKETVHKAVDKAKKNPVQTTLLGIGIVAGWICIRAWQHRRREAEGELWQCIPLE